jgi:chromosome segregation ATPase
MATAKKIIKKKTKTIKEQPAVMNDDLYICLHDAVNKRKLLLMALKDSLIVQEEYERILDLRGAKKETLKEIKENTDLINSKYQQIKKLLPNVKNVLSYTQKELSELETQIEGIKKTIDSDKQILKDEEELEKKLKKVIEHSKKEMAPQEVLSKTNIDPSIVKTPKVVQRVSKPVTKLDRIKNNLSLIEQKLKGL